MFTNFSSFARSAPCRFVCFSGFLLVCPFVSTPGFAQACVDTDGDGWGWNGSSSCLVIQAGNGAPSAGGLACVDDDGDGYGWNGFETCQLGAQTPPAVNTNASLNCIDSDGDGWGWNGVESCQVGAGAANSPGQATAAGQTAQGQTAQGQTSAASVQPAGNRPSIGNNNFNSQRDLVALHFDHAPDRDDGHAAVAALMVTDALQLNVQVVAGTHGVYSRGRYDYASEGLMSSVWGSTWHNAHSNRPGSVAAAVNRWTGVLAAGGSVWVAEGGPADFTAAVVRSINANHPEFNTRQRIHVIQHSDWNEDHSLEADLAYAKANTRYVKIADGNDPNATADFRFESHNNGTFVSRARSSSYSNEWGVAFNYLTPSEKLDFSDTVELMHILGIGINLIRDVNDFGDYFF